MTVNKVYVGSCIWRTVEVAHMKSLVPLLRTPGFGYYPQVGDALIDRARGISATYFLEKTDCDVHLSIDSDITGFTVEDTLKLVQATEEYGIVGGVYVCRSPRKTYPASYYVDGVRVVHAFDHTPVEVKFLATGFMAVHRRVFEKLTETVPLMAPEDANHFYAFYQPMAYEDEDVGQTIELSEDWAFCQRAKNAGFKCHIDPAIRLGHIGTYTYTLEDMVREDIPAQPLIIERNGQEWSAWSLSTPQEAEAARANESKALVGV